LCSCFFEMGLNFHHSLLSVSLGKGTLYLFTYLFSVWKSCHVLYQIRSFRRLGNQFIYWVVDHGYLICFLQMMFCYLLKLVQSRYNLWSVWFHISIMYRVLRSILISQELYAKKIPIYMWRNISPICPL
jgi:hypothetical protein